MLFYIFYLRPSLCLLLKYYFLFFYSYYYYFSKVVPDYSIEEGKSDMAMMALNINADLSPLFNWNVKQLFIYLVAEYKTSKNVSFILVF